MRARSAFRGTRSTCSSDCQEVVSPAGWPKQSANSPARPQAKGIEPRTPTKGAAMLRYLVGKRRRHSQRGQVFALTAMAMVALCGVAGFSIDVSTWYQTHRKQQSIADAAALAAVSDLPVSTSLASADAKGYAVKNGGSIGDGD